MATLGNNGGVLVKLVAPQSKAVLAFCANGKVLAKFGGKYKVRFDMRKDVDGIGSVVEHYKTMGWVEAPR